MKRPEPGWYIVGTPEHAGSKYIVAFSTHGTEVWITKDTKPCIYHYTADKSPLHLTSTEWEITPL